MISWRLRSYRRDARACNYHGALSRLLLALVLVDEVVLEIHSRFITRACGLGFAWDFAEFGK